jgi:hypothetical protein
VQILINRSLLFTVEFRLISSLSVYHFTWIVMYARPVVAIFWFIVCVEVLFGSFS